MKNADEFDYVRIPDDLDMHMYFKILEMVICAMKKKDLSLTIIDMFEKDLQD